MADVGGAAPAWGEADWENAGFVPGAAAYPEAWAEAAGEWRRREATLGRARLNHAYGADDRQRLDLFHPAGRARGLVVFVHGGYWMRFGREDFSHLAAGATARGWAVAMPSYRLAPGATLPEIVADAGAAVTAAAALVAGPLRLVGHSAGGHLVLRLAGEASGDVAARLARVVAISPVTDLRPLAGTDRGAAIGLDPATAAAESPTLAPPPAGQVTVWVGAEERPVFLDQALGLARAWDADLRIAPGRHHYDVIDGLAAPDSPLTESILA